MADGLPVRLLHLGPIPGWKTQAVYHVLTREMTESSPDTVVLCRPENRYLCLGYFQDADEVFDMGTVRESSIPVYRRRIGGGATYLDGNQLFYQFIFYHRRLPAAPERAYQLVLDTPLKTLQSFGLPAGLRALNELEVDGRRIAGIGGGRLGDGSVVVGNFLFDFDYETMSRVWRTPWPGYRELAERALSDHVYTLKKAAPQLTMSEVEERFMTQLELSLKRPVFKGRLTEREEKMIGDYLSELQRLRDDEMLTRTERRRPLKIAAGVFMHHFSVEGDKFPVRISCLEKEGRLADVRCSDEELATTCRAWRGKEFAAFESWLNTCFSRVGNVLRAM